MEIRVENPNNFKINEVIEKNLEMLYKLSLAGVKTISTAIDYYSIAEVYKRYSWIESNKERKELTASQCKVTLKTVENALALMESEIEMRS
ncbi:hypothetical protein D1Z97_03270 [Riemerella anatipestifer]|uniref:hypothetical protein n=1 Tax=Riemerella anatipestifer TaxID=34085 RepID=UPI00129DDDBB|nr:hypothetical protein [Riemerella anatipestifer]MBT0552522.1 hypothetical protein [Riemerella anatipestifer]MBT0554827.1 hypothetical protein [Riemerella anatipestifer]MCU7561005.1 hypothetical protein [Riemerella anatipestifer]MDY3450366.1 hypothetical protein [Riemerella anatipestifer]MRN00227.1 hypothetical protein [Riemerella anatipestifer]